jgi:hypothetical protein
MLACGFCYVGQRGEGAFDFSWALEGARVLLAGGDPYRAQGLGPTEAMLYYPLPTLWFAALFTPLPVSWAGPVFMGISSMLLASGSPVADGFLCSRF